jgi:GNAT superfamily N-acetyltransferase
MYERFSDHDVQDFVDMWKYRNEYASIGVECDGQIVGFGIAVENKIEYVAVSEHLSGMGLGKALVNTMVYCIREDGYKTSWLITADDPTLCLWYERIGFEHSSEATNSWFYRDVMVYRYRPLRKAAVAAKCALGVW